MLLNWYNLGFLNKLALLLDYYTGRMVAGFFDIKKMAHLNITKNIMYKKLHRILL